MKKFTRFAAAGLVFSAGLSLAACHPPNQKDSEEKIDTGATYTGEAPGAGAESSVAPVTETETEVATNTEVVPDSEVAAYTTPVQQ